MSFLNDAFYFEKHGDRYVYRSTVFSPGFEISEEEKGHLSRELRRLEWRGLGEGSLVVVVVAALFMSGAIESPAPIYSFLTWSIIALLGVGLTLLFRRDRLVDRILGHRPPDVPRLGFWQAMTRPRPLVAPRYAVPVLQSAGIMLGFAMITVDALVAYVIFVAYRSAGSAEGPDEVAAVEKLLSFTVHNPGFWFTLVIINAVLAASVVFVIRQVRRFRSTPDFV